MIVDSEHITVRSLQANLKGFGFDLGIDQVASLCMGGTMSVVADNLRRDGTALPATGSKRSIPKSTMCWAGR